MFLLNAHSTRRPYDPELHAVLSVAEGRASRWRLSTFRRRVIWAMKNGGSEPEQIVGYLNKLKEFPGIYGDISFTPDRHDGYPDDEIIMVEANSLNNGAFKLAPGYGA